MNISEGTGVSFLMSIKDIARGRWPFLAPTKNSRDDVYIAPFKEPNVHRATNIDMIQDITPRILSLNVMATASEERISSFVRTAKKATFVSTYTSVTIGIEIAIARGRFLEYYKKPILYGIYFRIILFLTFDIL